MADAAPAEDKWTRERLEGQRGIYRVWRARSFSVAEEEFADMMIGLIDVEIAALADQPVA